VFDLNTEVCGLKFKNPVLSASDDFGSTARMAKRVIDQGIGGLVTKTIHQIPGPHRWPRPNMFPLRKFGKGLEDTLYCTVMFSHVPYETWMNEEGPAIRKLCKDNNVRFIVSISGIGEDLDSWKRLARDQESLGAEMLELNLGGPHATFGAEGAVKDVGAPVGTDPNMTANVTRAVVDTVSIPVSCKTTPVSNISAVALACERAGASAISANNSVYGIFIDHETGTCYGVPCFAGFSMGRGLIGWHLAKAIEVTKSVKIPVLGIGGIYTHEDAVRYIMAGCSAVQVCSSKFLEGVGVVKKIIDGLDSYLEEKGYNSIKDFFGIALKDVIYIRDFPREEKMGLPSPLLPRFDLELCKPCDICTRLCPYGAIIQTNGKKPSVQAEHCMGCGFCVGVCPQDAIELIHIDSNEVVWKGRGLYKHWLKK